MRVGCGGTRREYSSRLHGSGDYRSGPLQGRDLGTIEVQDRCPLTLPLVAPDNSAIQNMGDRGRLQITVKIEKTRIQGLVPRTQIQPQVGRIVFG